MEVKVRQGRKKEVLGFTDRNQTYPVFTIITMKYINPEIISWDIKDKDRYCCPICKEKFHLKYTYCEHIRRHKQHD
jgi:hypothetical protein